MREEGEEEEEGKFESSEDRDAKEELPMTMLWAGMGV